MRKESRYAAVGGGRKRRIVKKNSGKKLSNTCILLISEARINFICLLCSYVSSFLMNHK